MRIAISVTDGWEFFTGTTMTSSTPSNVKAVLEQAESNARDRGYEDTVDYLWDCIVHFSDCGLAQEGDRNL